MMKIAKQTLIVLLLVLFPLLGLTAPPTTTTLSKEAANTPEAQFEKFVLFYRYLNGAYVDTVNNSTVVEEGIKAMLSQLDPHSSYLSAEEMVGVSETFEGSFSGIGVEFNVLNDTIIVVNVIAGGPSERVALLPNDRIVEVNGTSVIGTKQMDVPKILRGPKGSVVKLKVVRSGVKELLDFRITRDNIPINTVDAAYKINPTTGYIRVNRFANKTFDEFVEAFDKMGPIESLILDLRGNGGGLLNQAVLMSNFFLHKGMLIVSTEGLRVPPERIVTQEEGKFTRGRVIVLTNETTASASEIVSGAIQDWDRGLIIGRRTFGKGLVQQQFPLNDGSAVRLTVARYHTPTGRMIQRPYVNGKGEEYEEEFIKRFESAEEEPAPDTTQTYKTRRSKRTVYGGGGITPDIVVEFDTTGYNDYWSQLIRKGVLIEFVIEYMDKNRAHLTQTYPTVERFITDFKVDDKMLDDLLLAARSKEIEPKEEEIANARSLISKQLKALIAQKIWTMNEYFMVSNAEGDEVVAKALDALGHWSKYGQGIYSK